MTVREACAALRSAECVALAIQGNRYTILESKEAGWSDVMVEAFGDYIVQGIWGVQENSFEIEVKMKPVKKGDIA